MTLGEQIVRSEFNPNDKNFNFMMFTHSLKNYVFTNDRKGKKTRSELIKNNFFE